MANLYLQSIYDTVLAATVTYRTYAPTVVPGVTDEPTSVGPYDPSTHKILAVLPAGDVLWQYNGKDDSQFTGSQTLPAPAFTTGWINPTFSYAAIGGFPAGSNSIQLKADTGSASSIAVWWIDQELPEVPLTISYTQSIITGYTPAAPDEWLGGVIYYGDADEGLGYVYMTGFDNAGVNKRICSYGKFSPLSGGINSSITASTSLYATDVTLDVNTVRYQPLGYPPYGVPLLFGKDHQIEIKSTDYIGSKWTSFGSIFASGWGNSRANRIGLYLYSGTGVATGPVGYNFSNLSVRRRVM